MVLYYSLFLVYISAVTIVAAMTKNKADTIKDPRIEGIPGYVVSFMLWWVCFLVLVPISVWAIYEVFYKESKK